ncbi:MAG: YvcK family protein [Chloroflexi bacterium]|nr:YvcK family protein [Chloroflexota bacterium]
MQLRWLLPGMHVKRWLFLIAVGFAGFGLGVAVVLQDLYSYHNFRWLQGLEPLVGPITLRGVPHYHTLKALVLFSLAAGIVGYAAHRLNKSLAAALPPDDKLVDLVYRHRLGNRGPRIVAIGGGHGQSILLRGLRTHTDNLTAIVTVADDGGSSGKLRRELAILPPGDFRNCIAALSEAGPLMEQLLQYRFPEGSDLEGHSFGNLYIAAMRGVTGNFEAAISETGRILRVQGQILPSTLADLTLHARLIDGSVVDGESSIKHHEAPLDHVFVRPKHAEAHPEAVRALLEADVIVLGPGSLFTSVLPNLLVDGVAQAVRASHALKVYVCNVAEEQGETDSFGVADYVAALHGHVGPGLIDVVLVNRPSSTRAMARADHVSPEVAALPDPHIRVAYADVVDQATPRYHDPALLGAAIVELLRTVGRRGAPPPSNGHAATETYIPSYDEKTGEYVAVYVQ